MDLNGSLFSKVKWWGNLTIKQNIYNLFNAYTNKLTIQKQKLIQLGICLNYWNDVEMKGTSI